jgi:hypothetical protein
MMGIEPPNPAERTNIYLPKNLLARADSRAEELGMSRSSFFGLGVSMMIGWEPGQTPGPIMKPRLVAVRSDHIIRLPKASKRSRT